MADAENDGPESGRVAFLGPWRRRRGQGAFEALLRPHIGEMFRVAARLTGSATEAEDLVQSVLLRLYGRPEPLAAIRDLRPWLLRTVYNEFVDHWRRRRRSPMPETTLSPDSELISSAIDPGDDLETWAERAQFRERVAQALELLGHEHREVIILHDVEGYTMEEIETIAGVPIGTIKSRLHRARARLRELLRWP